VITALSNYGQAKMFTSRTIVGLLVTAGIILLGLSRIDLTEAAIAFAAVRVELVIAAAILVVAAIAIFAVRWSVLLPSDIAVPIGFVFSYLTIGYMMNAIIPLRIGDLARAYVLGRRHGIAVSITLSTVIVERVFDVVAIVIIGLLVSTMLDLPPLVKVGLRIFGVIGVTGVSVLYGLSFWGKLTQRLAWFNAESGPLQRLSTLLRRVDVFCEALLVLHDWRRLAATAVLTLAGWGVLSASLSLFAFSFGLNVPYLGGAIMMVATSLGASIPSAPGSAGVYHVLVVLALSVWKVPMEQAVAVGVLAHGVTIALHLVLGVTCAGLVGIRLSSLSQIGTPLSNVERSR
jgi:glycosyltransferase 2 family protein